MLPVFNHRPRKARLVARLLAGFAIVIMFTGSTAAMDAKVERGRYLVQLGGCNDCHTPGYFLGKPDMSRFLGGSDVGFEVPGLGTVVGPNLTPDKETGLGNWTTEEIITALQTGVRPDGRALAPVMPWRAFANLTRDDALAIVSYLKNLPPIHHKAAGPFGVSEKPTVPRMTILMPDTVTPHQ